MEDHFILRNLAEREGFDYRHFLQVAVKSRHSDNSLCLCGFQAHFQLRACCLRRLPTTSIDHENGITGITFRRENTDLCARIRIGFVNSWDRRRTGHCVGWGRYAPLFALKRSWSPIQGSEVHSASLIRCTEILDFDLVHTRRYSAYPTVTAATS